MVTVRWVEQYPARLDTFYSRRLFNSNSSVWILAKVCALLGVILVSSVCALIFQLLRHTSALSATSLGNVSSLQLS